MRSADEETTSAISSREEESPLRQVQVLLNASPSELTQIGGDFFFYKDMLRLSADRLRFRPLRAGMIRRSSWILRKALARACRTWEPSEVRRALFVMSRFSVLEASSIRQSKADVIFSHIWFPWVVGAQRSSVPIIWSSQGISPTEYYQVVDGGRWTLEDVQRMYGVVGARSDALMIWTHACAERVAEACPELSDRIRVIHPAVFVDDPAVDREKPSGRDGIVRLLFVGMDGVRKGLPEVVSAFRQVHLSAPDTELTVISRPPDELVEIMHRTRGVRFMSSSHAVDVKKLMAESDILLIPTHADTYATVAVEAMAHGCAVIISDISPLPEVAPDGEVGYVVPRGSIENVAKKTLALIRNRNLLREMQQNARLLYASRNHPDVMRSELERLVEELLARPRP